MEDHYIKLSEAADIVTQTAIEFAEWIRANGIEKSLKDWKWYGDYKTPLKNSTKTSKELYTVFQVNRPIP